MLLGNIDPVRVLRNGDPDFVERSIGECHRQAGEHYMVVPAARSRAAQM